MLFQKCWRAIIRRPRFIANFNPDEIYIPYVWNPRVENEVLTRWRKKILGYFDKGQRDAFEADPKSI